MRASTTLILTIAGLLVLALAFYYVDSVARAELTAGARLVIRAGTLAVVLAIAIYLIAWAWIALEHARRARERRREAREQRLEAEARRKQAELAANVLVTIAPAGSQVYLSKLPDSKLVTDPAHLIPGRVNGVESVPDPEEVRRWAFFNLTHGPARRAALPELPAPGAPALLPGQIELPPMVRLVDLLPGMRGDMNNLVLGVRLGAAGQLEPVRVSLHALFHTIVAASSGWGKSAFAASILAQLATCADPVELVLIDQQDHGLAAFKGCDRLRYPLLRQPGEMLGALREIYLEATRHRSALFARYDADNLEEYNQRAEASLPPIIVAVDEAATLLTGERDISAELKRQTWELRKFGVYQILCLTSAKGTTIDTDHRQQFSSKVQLHANDKGQARLLMDATEATTFPPGRAVIELPQHAPAVVQTPYIDKREVRNLLRPGPPPAPALRDIPIVQDGQAQKLAEFARLVHGGMPRFDASLQVFGKKYSGEHAMDLKRYLSALSFSSEGAKSGDVDEDDENE
jgi:hypothetical protein